MAGIGAHYRAKEAAAAAAYEQPQVISYVEAFSAPLPRRAAPDSKAVTGDEGSEAGGSVVAGAPWVVALFGGKVRVMEAAVNICW